MKKIFVCIIAFVLAVTATCMFVGCNNQKEEVATVTSISAKVASGTTFKVGDSFDATKVTVTATLSDKTTRTVSTTAALSFDRAAMELDSDGKFTKAGTYTVKVTYSDWSTDMTLTVSAND